MTLDEFVSRLQGAKRQNGGGYVARCPAHHDKNPSMSVTSGRDGRVLLHCHAGCTPDAIVSAMGLKMSDLMPEREREDPPPKQTPLRTVAAYDYQDADGKKVYRVTRYEPKTFRQAQWKDGRLVGTMAGVERVPYRLPKVLKAARQGKVIFVAEGEKDVETLERVFNATATCNAGGAGKWEAKWAKFFEGASHVYVLADNDPKDKGLPGQRHAVFVRDSLAAAGIPATALVMPDGSKDVTEWTERAERTRKDLFALIKDPPPWPDEWEFNRPARTEDAVLARLSFSVETFTFADLPDYVPENQDPNILVKGRWLERGGSAFWVSTAGTGKSIASEQLALSFAEGRPFAGLQPIRPIKFWVIQSEDSMSRLALDRADITAELAEQHPDVDWTKTWNKIKFIKYPGKVGAEFLDCLNAHLEAEMPENKPDVIIINPFFAFIGGPITDSAYVTPFLRGGEILHKPTTGLQYILERHRCAVLCFHHTPKPPTDKEIDGWMKSAFPEYQGAGSADITNWGRSFITMMRVKGHPEIVCLTAGKNGQELGWDMIDGARRRYMAYSEGRGAGGGRRHGWRDLTPEELAEVTKQAVDDLAKNVQKLVDMLKEEPMTYTQMAKVAVANGMKQRSFLAAWGEITHDPGRYELGRAEAPTGKRPQVFFGLPEEAKKEAETALRNWQNAPRPTINLQNIHKLSKPFESQRDLTFTGPNGYINTQGPESLSQTPPESADQLPDDQPWGYL